MPSYYVPDSLKNGNGGSGGGSSYNDSDIRNKIRVVENRVTTLESDKKASLSINLLSNSGGTEVQTSISQEANSILFNYQKNTKNELPNYINAQINSDHFFLATTAYVDSAIATARQKSATEFLLKDFNATFETPLEIPSVLTDIPNTQIKNVDITLDDETAAEYAIAGLVKYQVVDENNQRLNAFQVCSFSMDGQVTLRLRFMCAGQNSVFAKSVKGALLLKRREA